VPHATIEGENLKIRDDWGFADMALVAVNRRTKIPLVERPVLFVPAGQRANVDSIGPAALQLVGDPTTVFASTLLRLLDAISRQPIDLTTVSMWFASRLLVNPEFVVGTRQSSSEVSALLGLLVAFDRDHFNDAVQMMEGGPKLGIAYQDGQLMFMGRPIDRLASGYVALIKILQEIIASIAAWEAMRESVDLLNSDALIFIDEIDAHLHPRWQTNLLPFLKKQFPNATFVVTTHSPLIVRDTEPGEAYELVRDGERVTTRRLGSPRDWFFSDVLSDAFHVDLPAPGTDGTGEQPPLLDLLLAFATRVKQYAASRDDGERTAALALHESILPRLPEDDPRRLSLAQLRQLLG
ncbi:MAG: AAA family ATPase, partial [Myxococcales bacterium]|nr:AAA family ATPase [Myxococcales bacterium]